MSMKDAIRLLMAVAVILAVYTALHTEYSDKTAWFWIYAVGGFGAVIAFGNEILMPQYLSDKAHNRLLYAFRTIVILTSIALFIFTDNLGLELLVVAQSATGVVGVVAFLMMELRRGQIVFMPHCSNPVAGPPPRNSGK